MKDKDDGAHFDEEEFDEEDFFNEEDDEEELNPQANRRWVKVTVACLLAIVLIGNVLAFWPLVFNLDAIKFISKSRQLSQNEDVQQHKQAVVVVKAGDRKGTGFNISTEGYIITNHHVVEGEKFALVSFPQGTIHRADVIVSDPAIDIAILKIDAEGMNLPALEIKQDWENGTPVYVIGNPLFFNQIANEGIVLGMTALQDWDLPVMMIQAPIYKGNSGSPVINANGEVIAVIFATTKIRYEGATRKVGLAVPIHYLQKYMEAGDFPIFRD